MEIKKEYVEAKLEECLSFIKLQERKIWDKESYYIFIRMVEEVKEPEYAIFYAKLVPEIASDRILGVRKPALQKIARQIAKSDVKSYHAQAFNENKKRNASYEGIMIQAYVIGHEKEFHTTLHLLKEFLPLVDNWSINDSLCSALKITKHNLCEMYDFICTCLTSDETYSIRFAIVMLMSYYITPDYLEAVFRACDECRRGEYYIDMAVAWAISVCYVKYREETLQYLKECKLDRFTYNKSIQKMVESYRVTDEDKSFLKSLKRR